MPGSSAAFLEFQHESRTGEEIILSNVKVGCSIVKLAYLGTKVEKGNGSAQVEAAAHLKGAHGAATERSSARVMSKPAACRDKR